jgi:hypothetical protein
MKQYIKEFTHNVFVHPLMMFLPKQYANRLHDWNSNWCWELTLETSKK